MELEKCIVKNTAKWQGAKTTRTVLFIMKQEREDLDAWLAFFFFPSAHVEKRAGSLADVIFPWVILAWVCSGAALRNPGLPSFSFSSLQAKKQSKAKHLYDKEKSELIDL